MILTAPAGLALLALAVPVLALHVLRPHRPARPVSSTFLWRELASPVSAARPWQRLRPTALLAVQLLAVVVLAVAVAQPARTTPVPFAQHTVFVLDASGSMAATDGEPDRLGSAVARALLRDELPAGGLASVVVASDQPRVALSTSRDPQAFDDALATVHAAAGPADFASAFALAVSLETPGVGTGIVLLSDGGLDDAGRRVVPPGTRYERVGEGAANVALHRLSVELRGRAQHARVSVVNGGADPVTRNVRFTVDGRPAGSRGVTVPAGGTVDVDTDLPDGTRFEAALDGDDLLDADDRAFAVAGARRDLRVLVAGPDNVFLDAALATMPGVTVERVPGSQSATGYDLAVYDQVEVPAHPGAPFIALAPPGGGPDVAVAAGGDAEMPAVVLVRNDDPLLDGVDLSNVAIGRAQRIQAPKTQTLVGAEGVPLLARGVVDNRPFLYFSFALQDSTLPRDRAMPVLFDRAVTEVASAAPPPGDLTVGTPLPLAPGITATVIDPDGHEMPVAPGAQAPAASGAGFWTLRTEGRPDQVVAVNPAPVESGLAPVTDLAIPPRPVKPGEEPVDGQVPLLRWVAAAVLALLLIEVLLAQRRVGVPRRQWRWSLGVRATVAVLAVAALAGLSVTRDADRVATVFLIDGSDSMGPAGQTEAVGWVRDALRAQSGDAVGGVVLFARDAKVELTVRQRQELGRPAVKIDASRTNLATALRLSAALLPADARRRVVVVSDGRITEGDTAAEAGRLAGDGIRVDVHTIGDRRGPDVAVVDVDNPFRARAGDRVDLVARLTTNVAGPAVVTLDREGTAVDEHTVDLPLGSSTVTFSVVIPPDAALPGVIAPQGRDPALLRYRVRVASAADTLAENNVGFAPVQVEGPARVLVAEGLPGRAEHLAAALRAANLGVDVVEARRLPPLDELVRYGSVVLADVDVHDLSAEQTAALASSTHDLGHGLVTVGGNRAYGAGDYRHSRLEDLLPVISEVTDPLRHQDIAQVVAIDTSGSMGGAPAGGNANTPKSALAQAGTTRAIEALSPNDEVAILSVSDADRWVMNLQKVPPTDVVHDAVARLQPDGGTNLNSSLLTAAAALRTSKAPLKHIILFTDGEVSGADLDLLSGQARTLADEGITVSVMAAGDAAQMPLEQVAKSGRGRFYPGYDLASVPRIMQEETKRAARSSITEGDFLPEVTADDDVVAGLRRTPRLGGYVATTAKPTASTQLRIGPEHDPLLATWQAGLGRATSWTSDATARWSAQWVSWDGFVSFWSGVVKSTLPPADGGGAVRAQISGGVLTIRVESVAPFPDGATAVAKVTSPDRQSLDVALTRVDGRTFTAELPVSLAGTYAVGARVTAGDGATAVLTASTLAVQAYSAELRPGPTDPAALASVAAVTGGRVEPAPAAAFGPEGLVPGRSRLPLAGWLLLAAALLWPVALALSRLALRRPAWAPDRATAGRSLASLRRPPRSSAPGGSRRRSSPAPGPGPEAQAGAGYDHGDPPPPAPPPDPDAEPVPATTLDQLLAAKREGRARG